MVVFGRIINTLIENIFFLLKGMPIQSYENRFVKRHHSVVSCALKVEVTFWTLLVKWTSDEDICNVYVIVYITDRLTDVWGTVYSKLRMMENDMLT
jgi:hypothetical protein